MAKRTTKRKKSKKKTNQYQKNVGGAVLLLIAILGLAKAGIVGLFIGNICRIITGNVYAVALLIIFAIGSSYLILGRLVKVATRWWGGSLLTLNGILLYLSLQQAREDHLSAILSAVTWQRISGDFTSGNLNSNVGGGIISAYEYQLIHFLVGNIGVSLIAIVCVFSGLAILFGIQTKQVQEWFNVVRTALVRLGGQLAQRRALKLEAKQQAASNKKVVPEPKAPVVATPEPEPESSQPVSVSVGMAPAKEAPVAKNHPEESTDSESPEPMAFDAPADEDYRLPSAELLTDIPQNDQSEELKSIDKNAKVLQQTLDSFGVKAELKHVSLGPSVTKYELHPAIGVKVSKIVSLADDIALALAAKDIRIEAPIPGKSLIGIEVPNKEIATVSFRDVVESQPDNKGHLLQVPLGKDVNGNVVTADLADMPHLLIAGSTGSGKSVAINGIITSLLLNAKPSQVKLMLIDPKRVELGVYNGIPHLLSPVVSEPKKAARALQKVVSEMERRYELFAQFGQRKISTFNDFVAKNNQENEVKIPPLPYIVVIVDELADLMMTVSNDVEAAIIRLAQMGRAAGIHMILATQRPSVDVITGLIKANVPSRIAFAVSSGIDSRTIIDTNGAEKLLGRGDMLFLPIDKNTPVRVQGAFIPDQDVARVVDFITKQQTAEYDESMLVSDEEINTEEQEEAEDDLFNDALDFVVEQQKASTSLLQRHFRIGYNRAARLIDELEQRGYIGPQDGSRPRQVFKSKE
ncbi:DNA translocase FtsK [Lentilactobacillus senioris]|uniref:DNA translocase FtsK n=1 Tax=Lentilactobacillus senioris TaxID=931534 RepID=UPI002282DC0A|nr:DNA translocase FtsK [Lentilactobacillus senioris]MCY9807600.1 DNA translocase FtsK [Lentilactobacillus senioris]